MDACSVNLLVSLRNYDKLSSSDAEFLQLAVITIELVEKIIQTCLIKIKIKKKKKRKKIQTCSDFTCL